METIVIDDYNPEWPKEFDVLRSDLSAVLGPLALRIDHIGSTSVPGLGAKDIIDIQVTVADLVDDIVEKMTESMENSPLYISSICRHECDYADGHGDHASRCGIIERFSPDGRPWIENSPGLDCRLSVCTGKC